MGGFLFYKFSFFRIDRPQPEYGSIDQEAEYIMVNKIHILGSMQENQYQGATSKDIHEIDQQQTCDGKEDLPGSCAGQGDQQGGIEDDQFQAVAHICH